MATSSIKCLGLSAVPADSHLVADAAVVSAVGDEACGELVTVALACAAAGSEHSVDAAFDSVDAWGAKAGLKAKQARSAVRFLLLMFIGAAKLAIGPAGLRDDLEKLGVAPSKCDLISSRWSSEGPRLASAVAVEKQPAAGLPLVDADWRFGVTASTDEVGRVGSTFVQLKLTLLDGGSLRDEHLELSLAQFYALLGQLEKARSYAEYLQAAAAP